MRTSCSRRLAALMCSALALAAAVGACSSSGQQPAHDAGLGDDDSGTPGDSFTPPPDAGAPPSSGWKAVSAGGAHTCAIALDDRLWCWGHNSNGQLGDGTTTSRMQPAPVKNLGAVRSVDADWVHTCAVTLAGQAFCWGENDGMQLGDPQAESTKPFCNNGGCTEPVQVVDLSGLTAIGTGARHSCAVSGAGHAWCWGFNELGQLGDDKLPMDSARPSAVVGLEAALGVSASAWHSCAHTTDGKAYCWGDNADGNVGVATPSEVGTPVEVPGLSNVSAVVAGDTHTCLISGGTVFCFGDNGAGQLGSDAAPGGAQPVAVIGPSAAKAVAAGLDHSCAVDGAGEVWCWGSNGEDSNHDSLAEVANGKLGQPETVKNLRAAAKVSGVAGATAVAVGDQHSCALTATSRLWCWGSNADGQLGVQSPASSRLPLEVVAPR